MSSTTKSCEYCGRIGELTENKDGDIICRRCDDPDYQCRGCKVEASKHCDECGGYGSGDEEDEEEIKDVVFNCFTCGIPVIRDSEAHKHSKFDELNYRWCPDCPTPFAEEVDKYKLWKSQSIEITCRKCGDIGHKHDWNDCDDDMKYGTCGACEEEEEERKPCEDCGYYELMENDTIYGNVCECYADSEEEEEDEEELAMLKGLKGAISALKIMTEKEEEEEEEEEEEDDEGKIEVELHYSNPAYQYDGWENDGDHFLKKRVRCFFCDTLTNTPHRFIKHKDFNCGKKSWICKDSKCGQKHNDWCAPNRPSNKKNFFPNGRVMY